MLFLVVLVDGNFTGWTDSGNCSKTCGGGFLTQTRSCTNPPTQHGGQNCTGNTTRTVMCNVDPCPGIHADLFSFSKTALDTTNLV